MIEAQDCALRAVLDDNETRKKGGQQQTEKQTTRTDLNNIVVNISRDERNACSHIYWNIRDRTTGKAKEGYFDMPTSEVVFKYELRKVQGILTTFIFEAGFNLKAGEEFAKRHTQINF